MNTGPINLVTFKVHQAIGSLAIDGACVSEEIKNLMLLLAPRQISSQDVRRLLVEKYRQLLVTPRDTE